MSEKKLYGHPESLYDVPTKYCGGCGHGVIHRIISEVIDEMGLREKSIITNPVGCSIWADLVLTAYGTSARVCLGAKKLAEKEGIKVGLFRPITLWPFPREALGKIAESGKPVLAVEMSLGQMVEDERLAVLGKAPVHLLGHSGGVIPSEEEVFAEIKKILGK